MNENDYICKKHATLRSEIPLSHPRYECKLCKKRKVQGYTNPDHCPNPFWYLYLAPNMCTACSALMHKCMWCKCDRSD